jgi:hypothetical protein
MNIMRYFCGRGGGEGEGIKYKSERMDVFLAVDYKTISSEHSNPPSAGEFFFEFFRENRTYYSYKPLELFVFIRFRILLL